MYFALVILTLIVGASLALTTILISQIRIVRGMERSVAVFYAADTGIEHALNTIMGSEGVAMTASGTLANQTSYKYQIELVTEKSNPCGDEYYFYCITSIGTYSSEGEIEEVKRAIKVGN